MSFSSHQTGLITCWSGNPDCDAVSSALAKHLASAPMAKLPPGASLGKGQLGNIGETLAFLVGMGGPHPSPPTRFFGDNCHNPLAGGSKTGLDLVWIAFHPTDAQLDHCWIQEVKTTTKKRYPGYISRLKGDYEKLFGTNVSLSLESRLGSVAFQLEYTVGDAQLAKRARALGARSPSEVTRITLKPTGVHDLAANALPIIEDVRATLVGQQGWPSSLVEPQLIAISNFKERLTALVR